MEHIHIQFTIIYIYIYVHAHTHIYMYIYVMHINVYYIYAHIAYISEYTEINAVVYGYPASTRTGTQHQSRVCASASERF